MNPYDNDPREPIKEWEGIVEDVECGGCERTILSAHAVYNGYANGNYDACWICLTCDTENTTVFEAVEVGATAVEVDGILIAVKSFDSIDDGEDN